MTTHLEVDAYQTFLAGKRLAFDPVGIKVRDNEISAFLFKFQRDIVRWALHRGRAAVFADCGLGKTPIQLEWGRLVCKKNGPPVLIFAPLAVSKQTRREGEKFNVPVNVCRTQDDVIGGVNITNYEMLQHFDPAEFSGIVIDESSILKSYDGKTRRAITDFASSIHYRLACTATPAPNDIIELSNHSEFLGIMSGKEVVAVFFIQDGNTTHKWKLKGHATEEFWRWMASWAVAMRRPSDLGYDDGKFILPELRMHECVVDYDKPMSGLLFPVDAVTMDERRAARRETVEHRAAKIADLANGSDEPWLIWCNLNIESETAARMIPDAVQIRGSDNRESKESAMMGFSDGEIRVVVTKPTIAGFGMNWQHCRKVAFLGLSDSYEQLYQAVRRCWRFGQDRDVDCHIVTSNIEGRVVENIRRKEIQAAETMGEIVKRMSVNIDLTGEAAREEAPYIEAEDGSDRWRVYTGDSNEVVKRIESDSVGLSVFSPPFPGMYAYTNTPRDVGNCRGIEELLDHYEFLVPELLRVTMPGRSCCVHLAQEPVFKRDGGCIGLRDFRGALIQRMQNHGWTYFAEVTIDKNPQVKAARTKDSTLLFKTLGTDSAGCRMALADYLVVFKKPGDNPIKIPAGRHKRWNPDGGWITSEEWIEWAAPVWYRQTPEYPGGIRETDVLSVREARDGEDQKHLCPLQLGVIERAIKLWSAPGDLVFSPYAGIGSEGYMAVKLGRRFAGIEIKPTYAAAAIRNIGSAEREMMNGRLL